MSDFLLGGRLMRAAKKNRHEHVPGRPLMLSKNCIALDWLLVAELCPFSGDALASAFMTKVVNVKSLKENKRARRLSGCC